MGRTNCSNSNGAPRQSRIRRTNAALRRPGRRRYARWRAVSLSLVYLAFAAHIIHWKLTGSTLAPLELNEVMYTLELGIVTAGFLFMCFLVLGTLIFGRFFCSWACHIMVLQEMCAWLLRKIGIQPKVFRSRLLLYIAPLTAFYMFLWPQIVRAWHERAIPTFHYATDREGWASFATNNFWRNLPGPWIIALTFVVCGFLVVYVLGTRTFCTYVCPYGAIFGLADRFAIGRIHVNHDLCKHCGQCTKACTSAVRVHCETAQFGTVVNPSCLKCLDCVSVCPQEALSYGFSTPALFKSQRAGGRFGLPYDFSLGEDLLAASVFVVVLLTFRGLYGRIPFLLSLAMGLIVGYLAVLTIRTWRRADVSLSTLPLTNLRRFTPAGWAFQAFILLLTAFVFHSAFVRYHEFRGLRDAIALTETKDAMARNALAASASHHLLIADRWGLFANERVERSLARSISGGSSSTPILRLRRIVPSWRPRERCSAIFWFAAATTPRPCRNFRRLLD
ncbi:MAG: 4Fe-4S binding protein [Planctomycetes bacterium]|nr:4Fe-4S binding protein [Planctomycetota bacterium]